MAKTFPKPGTYTARRSGPIVVYESDAGALMADIPVRLLNADIAFSFTHSVCLGKIDGTLMTKTFETLHKIFPSWEGNNPFDLQDVEIPEGDGAEFELAECDVDDSYISPTTGEAVVQFKARWLNALGAGRRAALPDDEKEQVVSKWSVKWDAISGKPAAAAKPAPAAKKEAPAKRQAPPAKKAAPRTATMEDVWNALVKKNEGVSEDDISNNILYPAADEIAGQSVSDVTTLTPEQWGAIADKLGV